MERQMDTPLAPPPQLICPQCESNAISLIPLQGKEENWFAGLTCRRCGEQAFFQIDPPNPEELDFPKSLEWTESILLNLQKE